MRSLSELAAAYADAACETFPMFATALGRHEHDHRLGGFDPATVAGHARDIAELRAEVTPHLDVGDPTSRADAAALDGLLATRQLALEDEQLWRRNPDVAVEGARSSCFAPILREFAPLDERLAALTDRLAAIPAYLDGGPPVLVRRAC